MSTISELNQNPQESLALSSANSDHELMMHHADQPSRFSLEAGKIGWAILWLLGVLLPLLLVIYLIWGR